MSNRAEITQKPPTWYLSVKNKTISPPHPPRSGLAKTAKHYQITDNRNKGGEPNCDKYNPECEDSQTTPHNAENKLVVKKKNDLQKIRVSLGGALGGGGSKTRNQNGLLKPSHAGSNFHWGRRPEGTKDKKIGNEYADKKAKIWRSCGEQAN